MAALAADEGIHEKILIPGTRTLISNKGTHSVLQVVKSLTHSGLLLQSITKTIENETKETKKLII